MYCSELIVLKNQCCKFRGYNENDCKRFFEVKRFNMCQ